MKIHHQIESTPLLLHDFEIQLEGVRIKKTEAGFALIGIKCSKDFKGRTGVAQDNDGNLVLTDDPTKGNTQGFSSLDNNFAYLIKNTDILQHKVISSKIVDEFNLSNFKNVSQEDISKFQEDRKGSDLQEWCLRNPSLHNYTTASKFLQSQSWRSENTQGYFFASLEDKQKISTACISDPYPEVRYSGPMNIYANSIPTMEAPKKISKEEFDFIRDSFSLNPPRIFQTTGKKTSHGVKIDEYDRFLNSQIDSGQKVLDLLKDTISGKNNDYFTPEVANSILADYCNAQKTRFTSKDRDQNKDREFGGGGRDDIAVKMFSIALQHGQLSGAEVGNIIEGFHKDSKIAQIQSFNKLTKELKSLEPENADKKLSAVLTSLSPKKAEELIPQISDHKLKIQIEHAYRNAQAEEIADIINSLENVNRAEVATLLSKNDAKKSLNSLGKPTPDEKLITDLHNAGFDNINMDKNALMQLSNHKLAKLPNEKIAVIVESIAKKSPENAATILLHLGDQEKSKSLLDSLTNKQFAQIITAKNFVNPYKEHELEAKVQERLEQQQISERSKITPADKKLDATKALSQLLHGNNKGIKTKVTTFIEKYATKKQEYKSFAEHIKNKRAGNQGKSR